MKLHIAAGLAGLVITAGGGLLVMLTVARPPEPPRPTPRMRERSPLSENLALRHVRATPELKLAVLALAAYSGLAGNFDVLLPLAASQTWGGGADLFGWLTMAVGLGQTAGALYCLARPRATFDMVAGAGLATSFGCVGAALATSPAVQFLALLLYGTGYGLFAAAIVTILQARSDPERRGRVMALYTMVGLGPTLPGSLAVGGIAATAGPSAAWLFQAAAALAVVAIGEAGRRLTGRRPGTSEGVGEK